MALHIRWEGLPTTAAWSLHRSAECSDSLWAGFLGTRWMIRVAWRDWCLYQAVHGNAGTDADDFSHPWVPLRVRRKMRSPRIHTVYTRITIRRCGLACLCGSRCAVHVKYGLPQPSTPSHATLLAEQAKMLSHVTVVHTDHYTIHILFDMRVWLIWSECTSQRLSQYASTT